MPVKATSNRDVSHAVVRAIRPRADQIKAALAQVRKKRPAKAVAYDSDLDEDD